MRVRPRGNRSGSTVRFTLIVVAVAAVLFVAIQLVPRFDDGRPYNDVMPVIEMEEVAIRSAAPLDGAALEINVDSCAGQPIVDQVEESATEVRLRVLAQVEGEPDACPTTMRVQLQRPLGDRVVIDGTTGSPVDGI